MTGCMLQTAFLFCGAWKYFRNSCKKGEEKMTKREKILLKASVAFALLFAVAPTVNAMHIMEGYLPAAFCVAWGIICLPFLAAGIFTAQLLGFFRRHMKAVRYTVKVGGVLMILMGVLMFTGKMNDITGYLSTVQSEQEVTGQNETEQNESEQSKNGTDEESDAAPEESSTEEDQDSADNTESTLTPAPLSDFELTDQFGNTHTLADYEGKVIFLNFWATWCGPCRNEMPDIQKLYEEYSAQGEDAEVVSRLHL